MAFCPNCGAPIEEGARFCASCGSAVGGASAPMTAAPAPVPARKDVAAMIFSIVSLACGISAAVFAVTFVYAFVSLFFSIAGLIFAKQTTRRPGANDGDRKRAKIGKVLSIIALIVGILATVILLILIVLMANGSVEFNPSTDIFPFT